MPALLETQSGSVASAAGLGRCVECGLRLEGRAECQACGRDYAEVDGILRAIGPLRGSNRIAADFYDGPDWATFKFWEQVFLWLQGPGIASARRQVLGHLPRRERLRVLEVGIGDGENVPLLPVSWEVFGVDISFGRLESCRDRFPTTKHRLAWAEAEALPFENNIFDAVFTVGGINYFRDPTAALNEMRRVAKPGATLVAADENPELYRFGIGHMIGIEAIDRFWLGLTGLDKAFVEMVLDTPACVEKTAARVWPRHRRVPIWNRLGYCLVDTR